MRSLPWWAMNMIQQKYFHVHLFFFFFFRRSRSNKIISIIINWQLFILFFFLKGNLWPPMIPNTFITLLYLDKQFLVQPTVICAWNTENFWQWGQIDIVAESQEATVCSVAHEGFFLPWPYYIWLVILIHKLNQIKREKNSY